MALDRLMERETRMVVAMGVEANGTTAVTAINIPPDMEVSNVWARSSKAGTGAANIIIGDADDDNGWVEAQDHTQAIGTVIGKTLAEIGAYGAVNPGTDDGPLRPKLYTAVKNILIELSAAGTIQSKWDVFATMTPVPDSIA